MSIQIKRAGALRGATAGQRSQDRSPEILAQGLGQLAQGAQQAEIASARIQQNVSQAYVAREESRIALEMEKRLEELRLGMDGRNPGAFSGQVAEDMSALVQTELDAAPVQARGQLGNRMRNLAARIQQQALEIEAKAAVDHINQSFTEGAHLDANRLLSNPDLFDELAAQRGEDIGMLEQPEAFKRALAYESLRTLTFGAVSGRIMQPSEMDEDGQFVNGPERALRELHEGKYDNKVSDDEKRALIAAAEREIAVRRAGDEAEDKAQTKWLRDKVGDWIEGMLLDRPDAFLADTESLFAALDVVDDPVLRSDVSELLEMRDVLAGFRTLGLADMQARRDAFQASINTGTTTEMQGRVLKGMDSMIAETEELGRRDPIGVLTNAGLVRQRAPLSFDMTDPNNPQGPTAEQWQQRAIQGRMAEEYLGQEVVGVLSPQEAGAMSLALRQMAPDRAAEQLAIMAKNLPQTMVQGVAGQLWQGGEDALATAVAIAPQSQAVAEQIIRGQQIVESDQFMLSKNKVAGAISDDYYTLFDQAPSLYEAMVPAALAIYAASVPAADLTSDSEIDGDAFEAAMDAVSGGMVRTPNGDVTIVPRRGMTQDSFNALLTNYVGQMFSADGFTFTRYGHAPASDGSLGRMGEAGIPSGIGGVLTPDKFIEHASLRPHSDGVYYVMIGGRPVMGGSGQPFLLNVGQMFDDYTKVAPMQHGARPQGTIAQPVERRALAGRAVGGEMPRPGGRIETGADL